MCDWEYSSFDQKIIELLIYFKGSFRLEMMLVKLSMGMVLSYMYQSDVEICSILMCKGK